MGAWNFEILVEDSDNGGPSSIAVQRECLFTIFIPICELCLKNDEGRQKALLNEGDEGEVTYMEKSEEKLMTHLKFHH